MNRTGQSPLNDIMKFVIQNITRNPLRSQGCRVPHSREATDICRCFQKQIAEGTCHPQSHQDISATLRFGCPYDCTLRHIIFSPGSRRPVGRDGSLCRHGTSWWSRKEGRRRSRCSLPHFCSSIKLKTFDSEMHQEVQFVSYLTWKEKSFGLSEVQLGFSNPQLPPSKTPPHDNGTVNRDSRATNVTRGGR